MKDDLKQLEPDRADYDLDATLVDDLDDDQEFEDYRSLSGLAVAALICGLLSVVAYFHPFLLLVPLLTIVLGVLAVIMIRREREYYSGTIPALIGMILALFLGTTAGGVHWVLGVISVPDGYREITFWELQPDENHPDMPIPPTALELDGKRVFVKGYVYPGTQRRGLKRFTFVPDMKSCCFGGQPALTDMIEVTLEDPLRVSFAYRRRGLGGILRVHRDLKPNAELTGVYYELEADYLK